MSYVDSLILLGCIGDLYRIYTVPDASKDGLGAVLFQVQDGVEQEQWLMLVVVLQHLNKSILHIK